MKLELSTGDAVVLTPAQAMLLLHMCNAMEHNAALACIHQGNEYTNPIREASIASCLVRKGLAVPVRNYYGKRMFRCTAEGYWLGDTLRILNRQGRIPARRTP